MNLNEYQEERRVLVDSALGEFVHPRYGGELLELAAHVVSEGQGLRGTMTVI